MAETQAVTNLVKEIYDKLAASIDTERESAVYIDYVHEEIHKGHHFTHVTNKTASAASDFINVMYIGQGSTKKRRHMIVDVSADKAGTIYFIEDILSSGAGGTTATALNNDRISTIVSEHKIKVQPTTKSSGSGRSTLWASYVGASAPPVRIGGVGGSRNEFVLASSKSYCLRFDPDSIATKVLIVAQWYEE